MIGNAVPVKLAQHVASSLKKYISEHLASKNGRSILKKKEIGNHESGEIRTEYDNRTETPKVAERSKAYRVAKKPTSRRKTRLRIS